MELLIELQPDIVECPHRWRYFVDVNSHRIGSRRCERCGEERTLAQATPRPPAVSAA